MNVARILGIALLALVGCARPNTNEEREVAWLVVEARGIDDLERARFLPNEAVSYAVRNGSAFVIAIDVRFAVRGVRVEIPGACPLLVPSTDLRAGETTRREAQSVLELIAPARPRDVGFDAPLHVEAKLACGEGTIEWRQIAGAPLREIRAGARTFDARMPMAPSERPWGIVPISPRTAGEVDLEAELRDGATIVRRSLRVSAASRSRGLPSVGVTTGVLLSGNGWRIDASPIGTVPPTLESSGGLTRFFPDASGRYVLRDIDGKTLPILAGRYDETPLDCGRCHAAIAKSSAGNPMTKAFASAPSDCRVACHTSGEIDARDGGFSHVSKTLRPSGIDHERFEELPRPLRRLGAVGCLACHGPATVAEESARWAILRADVCAHCHDAPPRYGHVVAWRASRMAHADDSNRARTDAACARCHTTHGFLAHQAGIEDKRVPPSELPPLGIGCAACHAVHDASSGRASLRSVRVPKAFENLALGAESRICVACHAPDETGAPQASAAAIVFARGGIDPLTSAPIEGTPTSMPNGCIGCHRNGPTDVERGAGHAFKAAHRDEASDRKLHDEAKQLLSQLLELDDGAPVHASTRSLPNGPRGLAMRDVLLVYEDPAAATHNASYARALLFAAKKAIHEGGTP